MLKGKDIMTDELKNIEDAHAEATATLTSYIEQIMTLVRKAEEVAASMGIPFDITLYEDVGGTFGLPDLYLQDGEYCGFDDDPADFDTLEDALAELGEDYIEQWNNRSFVWNRWLSSSELC